MIIQCLKIRDLDGSTGQDSTMESVGKQYQVLEIYYYDQSLSYRIIPDSGGTPIIVSANDYKVIGQSLPLNFVITQKNDGYIVFGPESWATDALWEESFWVDFCNDLPKAITCYEKELETIKSTDSLP